MHCVRWGNAYPPSRVILQGNAYPPSCVILQGNACHLHCVAHPPRDIGGCTAGAHACVHLLWTLRACMRACTNSGVHDQAHREAWYGLGLCVLDCVCACTFVCMRLRNSDSAWVYMCTHKHTHQSICVRTQTAHEPTSAPHLKEGKPLCTQCSQHTCIL